MSQVHTLTLYCTLDSPVYCTASYCLVLPCIAPCCTAVSPEDLAYVLQALELAKRALGKTYPNPAVGCVIVKDGKARVVGEGFHPQAGMPHAEVYALRAAGTAAKGATAYVTLEPCNHYGRTPPCSQALVDAGVARVVVGCGDPNPLVAAAGIATLQSAGIEVALVGGAEQQQCYDINHEFMERMKQQAASV
ncbi:cytidine deaminase-like protein [Scenedesmus sp. NREL 46B-D3]|nr:cytidine deaminase-like protein [Scenedesmus sp. NREL 46B-D3]